MRTIGPLMFLRPRVRVGTIQIVGTILGPNPGCVKRRSTARVRTGGIAPVCLQNNKLSKRLRQELGIFTVSGGGSSATHVGLESHCRKPRHFDR